jgi:tRNA pseudouridine38-40 synthase
MRTLKITLAYDGTRFVGWQRQAEGESIQGLLEEALGTFEGGPVTAHGAGRTDAGVHALGQVASATVSFPHPIETVARALNARLPEDIRVLEVADAPPDFHARFSAPAKISLPAARRERRRSVHPRVRVAACGTARRRRDA